MAVAQQPAPIVGDADCQGCEECGELWTRLEKKI